mgnify:FL=1
MRVAPACSCVWGGERCLCEVRGLARDPTTHCSCPCHDRPHVLFSNGPTCTVYSQGTVYSRGVTEAQRRWAPRTNLNSKATASLHKFEEVPAAASRRNNSRNAPKGTMRTAVEQGSPARGASNASCSASGRLRVASADSGGPSAGLPRKLFAWDRCVTMWCGDGCSTPRPACSGPVRRLYTSRRIDSRRLLSCKLLDQPRRRCLRLPAARSSVFADSQPRLPRELRGAAIAPRRGLGSGSYDVGCYWPSWGM